MEKGPVENDAAKETNLNDRATIDAEQNAEAGTEQNAEAGTEQKPVANPEPKNSKKKSAIKMGVAVALAAIMLILAVIAWFTMSKEAETSKMELMSTGPTFEILTDANEGTYADKYKELEPEGNIWLVDESNNFSNYTSPTPEAAATAGATASSEDDDQGIEPGSSGKMKFLIRATEADSVTLNLEILLKGVIEDEDTGDLSLMTKADNSELLTYLNSHILLFENYNSETGKYSGLIENDGDLERILANKTYVKDNEEYTYIYWVWPMYLNNLIGDDSICSGDAKTELISYIGANKDGFFKNLSKSSDKIIEDLTEKVNYSMYSEYFDKVDLEIGNNIDYVIMSLEATEATGN